MNYFTLALKLQLTLDLALTGKIINHLLHALEKKRKIRTRVG